MSAVEDLFDAVSQGIVAKLGNAVDSLRRLVEVFDEDQRKRLFFELAQELYESVWSVMESLLKDAKATMYPGTAFQDVFERLSGEERVLSAVFDPRRSIEGIELAEVSVARLKRVFISSQFTICFKPLHANYVVTFWHLLCDPDIGIERIFRCEWCRRFGISTYRRRQRFCAKSQCSAKFHNRKKAPKMAEYMREYRRTLKRRSEKRPK